MLPLLLLVDEDDDDRLTEEEAVLVKKRRTAVGVRREHEESKCFLKGMKSARLLPLTGQQISPPAAATAHSTRPSHTVRQSVEA